MIVPNPLGTKLVQLFGSLLIGGLLSTGVYAGAKYLPEFTTTGTLSSTTKAPMSTDLNVFVSATGSTTIRYPSSCVANPFLKLLGTAMSGTVTRLDYQNKTNPTGASADIGFVKGCGDSFGSGASLIDNTTTSSGSVSTYSTGTAAWNSADFMKTTFSKYPGAGFQARLKVYVQGRFGNH